MVGIEQGERQGAAGGGLVAAAAAAAALARAATTHPVLGRPHLLEPGPGPLGLRHQLCGLLANLHRPFAAGVRFWSAGRVYAADSNASTASPGRSLAYAPRPGWLSNCTRPEHRKANLGRCKQHAGQAAGQLVVTAPCPPPLPPWRASMLLADSTCTSYNKCMLRPLKCPDPWLLVPLTHRVCREPACPRLRPLPARECLLRPLQWARRPAAAADAATA